MSTNQTSTQNTSSTAANTFMPYLQQIAQRAQSLYDSGQGTGTWNDSTNADLNQGFLNAFNGMNNYAGTSGGLFTDALNRASNQSTGTDLAAQVNPWLQQLMGISNGSNNIGTGNAYMNVASGSLNNSAATSQMQNDASNWLLNGWQNNVAQNLLSNIAQRGGTNDIMNQAWGALDNIYNRSQQGTAADQYLSEMASGQNQTNPFLQQLLDANATRIGNRAASLSSGAGRYGSAGMYDALNRSIAETNNPLLFQSAENERNRQLTATQEIGNQRQQMAQLGLGAGQGMSALGQNAQLNQMNASNLLGESNRANLAQYMQGGMNLANINQMNAQNQLAGLQGQSNVANMNIGNQMQAAQQGLGGLFNQEQAMQNWNNVMSGLYGSGNNAFQTQLGLGSYLQNRDQNSTNQQIQNFYQQQMNPWLNLMRYTGALGGLGGFFGNAGTTTTQQGLPFTSLLGLGVAGLGAAGSLFSDRRAKTDIEFVGVDEATGLTMYAYRYASDPKTYPKVVGPMAQEVAEKYPHLVAKVGNRLVIRL